MSGAPPAVSAADVVGTVVADAVALAGRRPGQQQIQAAMAGCHAAEPTAQAMDWPRIARLYQRLADMTCSRVVELDRAVAVAMADGVRAGRPLSRHRVPGRDRYAAWCGGWPASR